MGRGLAGVKIQRRRRLRAKRVTTSSKRRRVLDHELGQGELLGERHRLRPGREQVHIIGRDVEFAGNLVDREHPTVDYAFEERLCTRLQVFLSRSDAHVSSAQANINFMSVSDRSSPVTRDGLPVVQVG